MEKTIKRMQKGFDAYSFIADVTQQNADALMAYFAPDAVIRWHDSNEQFSVSEYIRANCEYPDSWDGNIERIEKIADGLICVSKIFSGTEAHFVVSLIKLKDGKITQLDEYFSECGDVPQWRRDMNIGKPIIVE